MEDMIRALVERQGYETLHLSISQARHVVLTLDVDPGPVTMDDCVLLNRAIRRELEEGGLSSDDYAVDVESPGVRRPLLTHRHFERCIGERARVRLAEPRIDGTQVLRGVIEKIEGQTITLRNDVGKRRTVDLDEINDAYLEPSYT